MSLNCVGSNCSVPASQVIPVTFANTKTSQASKEQVLCLVMDNLWKDNQALQAENTRLRNGQGAAGQKLNVIA